MTICLTPAGTLNYDEGGGHFWVFLNWALGLRSLGYRVIWLELVGASHRSGWRGVCPFSSATSNATASAIRSRWECAAALRFPKIFGACV